MIQYGRSLPEVVIMKIKGVLCFMGLPVFLSLTAERFYRLQQGDILWLRFNPTPVKYLEWLIADPGPFILGAFICAYALSFYWRKVKELISGVLSEMPYRGD